MPNWLRQAIKPMDLLIAVVGLYLFFVELDFSNMSTVDNIYAVCFGIWFVLLVVRCYILWRKQA